MYEKPPALFLVSFWMLYNDIMLSAVMPIGSLVFSVGSVVFPASSFIRDKMVYSSPGWVPGCSFSSCIGFPPYGGFR